MSFFSNTRGHFQFANCSQQEICIQRKGSCQGVQEGRGRYCTEWECLQLSLPFSKCPPSKLLVTIEQTGNTAPMFQKQLPLILPFDNIRTDLDEREKEIMSFEIDISSKQQTFGFQIKPGAKSGRAEDICQMTLDSNYRLD